MKIKDYLFHLWPVVFIIAVWFIFSAPYFLQHKVPYPSRYQVSFFTPWNEYPEYAMPVKNNALSDVVDQLYPWKHFSIEELRKGSIPYWNPYSFSGTPHLANYQSAVLSPLNLLFFVLPFVDAWSMFILLQPLLAGLFMYFFVKELQVSKTGSVIAGVSFMFCGFLTTWMAYGTMSMAISFLPLTLLVIEKIFSSASPKIRAMHYLYSFLLSVSLITSFLSGHFQMSLYLACYVFAYLIFKLVSTKNIRVFFLALGFYSLGILVSTLQVLPALELYKQAVRSELFSNAGGIPWYYLVTIFAPDFFGNPVTRNDWVGHYAEWASFIGIIPLTLAIFSLFIKKNKTVLFFFFAGIVSLIFALDTPLQQFFTFLKIPVFSTSIPSRIIVLFSFSFVVLAGFGFDLLLDKIREKSIRKIIYLFIPISLLLFTVWIYLIFFNSLPIEKTALAKRNFLLPSLLFFLFFALVFSAHFVKKKQTVFFIALGLLFLVTFDSLRFASKWMPFEERQFIAPKIPVISAMQKNIGEGRVYGDFGAYIDTYFYLPSIEGYDPLYSKRYGEFLQSAKTGEFTPAIKSLALLDESGKYTQRVLDLLGVVLIYQPISHTNQPWAFPVWRNPENFPTVYRDERIALFKNSTAMPRTKLFYQYEVIKNDKDLLNKFYSENFDFRNVLLLEEDPNLTSNLQSKISNEQGKDNKSVAKIVAYSPNRVILSAFTNRPALLFISDNYYPNWKAKVNEKEAKIYRADYSFRAVIVSSGESKVEFYYRGLF